MKRVFRAFWVLVCVSGWAYCAGVGAVEVEVLAKAGASWDGQALGKYPAGRPEVTILRVTVPVGVRMPMHRHPVISAGVLLTGELTVETEGGEQLHLVAGDSVVEVVDTWHYGRNDGDVPAEIVVFYAGVEGEPISVVKGG